MTGTYRYVRHKDVPSYEKRGWVRLPALDGTHHGEWSVLMQAPQKEVSGKKDLLMHGLAKRGTDRLGTARLGNARQGKAKQGSTK